MCHNVKTNFWALPVVLLFTYVSCHSKITNLEHKAFSYQDVSGSKVTVHNLTVTLQVKVDLSRSYL